MAFTTAATAKTASDAASLTANPAVGSLTETLINTGIGTQSTRTDTKTRNYTATFTLDADINGRTSPVEIVQSDASRIILNDLVSALDDAGYRVSFKDTKIEGSLDKVKLTVAWDNT